MTEPAGDFPIEWLDPSDPDLTWEWDDMHMPFVLTPMAGDYVGLLASGFAYGYARLSVPELELRQRTWNGYAYFALAIDAPEAEHDAIFARRTEASRAAILTTDAYWREQALPEIQGVYRWIVDLPVASMAGDDLAAAWDEVWRRLARCWSIHFWVIRGPYQVIEDLADLYESIVTDASPGEATGLIGGSITELHDVARQIETLTALAAAEPVIADRLAAETTVADLAELPEAADFLDALDRFLIRHGHLGQNFDDLALASWIEEPGLLFTELAKRLEHPPEIDEEARREGLAAHADALAEKAREAIGDDPTKLAQFESLLASAREIGHLTETHNYWIDRHAQSTLRRFVMLVGSRLAETGVIADRPDILYLHRAEVPDLLQAPIDRRALVEERRAATARWATIRPPRAVGKPATASDEVDRFDGARYTSTEPDELRGTGASAGIVRGRARLTLSQADFGAVQAGDIIVCPSSNPSWVPLFAIAGGLITDTGGVLSHAAVVAREFALPAVVGTGDATQKIADGRWLEIDGTTGIVRLL